jgi:hypothetical protein
MEFVPLDDNLPDVVAKIVQYLEPEFGSQHAKPATIPETTGANASGMNPAASVDPPALASS